MAQILFALGLTAAFTYFVASVLDYNRIRFIWAGLISPALVFGYWLLGIGYINSSWCEPQQICDGGGMLAFSASTIVLFLFVLGSSIGAIFVYWLRRRRV